MKNTNTQAMSDNKDKQEREAFEAEYRRHYGVPSNAELNFPDVPSAWAWWQKGRAALSQTQAGGTLTQEERAQFVHEICEYGTDFVAPLFAVVENIEKAVLARGPTVAELTALLPGTYYLDPPDGGSVTLLEQLQRMARDAEAYRRINTPELHDFMEGMRNEVLHQVERWGQAHDRSKSAENWYWLVGYLAGKALRAAITGDRDKALHHTISSAAALANWHAAILADTTGAGVGEDADLRPAPYPAHGEPGALEQGDAL